MSQFNDEQTTEDYEVETDDESNVFEFPTSKEEFDCYNLVTSMCILTILYIQCCSILFCSSCYVHKASNIDSIINLTDTMVVDISSAFFFTAGFSVAYMHQFMTPESFSPFMFEMILGMVIDSWIVTIPCIVLGAIHELIFLKFNIWSSLLTLFEGMTMLHVADFDQAPSQMHSYNVTTWPIHCLIVCLVYYCGTHRQYKMLKQIYNSILYHSLGFSMFLILACCTYFTTIHQHTNAFYIISTHNSYRLVEFYLGVHFLDVHSLKAGYIRGLRNIVYRCRNFAYGFFFLVWWSLLGLTPYMSPQCIRMHAYSFCLPACSLMLLRGVCLGVVIVVHSTHSANYIFLDFTNAYDIGAVVLSSVALGWPIMLLMKICLFIAFDASTLDNFALLSWYMLFMVVCITSLYVQTIRNRVIHTVHAFLQKFFDFREIGVAVTADSTAAHSSSKQPPTGSHTILDVEDADVL